MASLKEQLAGPKPVLAPLVFNPLMAKLAEAAGFEAIYLGGGSTGYVRVFLEANLTLTEMAELGIQIRTASDLPLILDAAAGFGDPMHIHRTIRMTEAAGFAAIEIEDQILPKRAHHHTGLEHMVPQELMEAKVREAVAVRKSPDFLIVARTNGVRASNMDDALKRAEGYRRAGADLLLLSPRNPEEARHIAERLGPPLMFLASGGVRRVGLTVEELGDLGYRLIADPLTPLIAAHDAWRDCYRGMAGEFNNLDFPQDRIHALQDALHDSIGLDRLLAVERATVERG